MEVGESGEFHEATKHDSTSSFSLPKHTYTMLESDSVSIVNIM